MKNQPTQFFDMYDSYVEELIEEQELFDEKYGTEDIVTTYDIYDIPYN